MFHFCEFLALSNIRIIFKFSHCAIGNRKEKLAMLESKCRPHQHSAPDLCEDDEYNEISAASAASTINIVSKRPPIRRTRSDDIKERVLQLEKAMTNSKYNTKDQRLDKNDPG